MKTIKLLLSLALLFFFCANLHAQVTIGGTDIPKSGAILDLNSTTKGGLVLSNVTIADLELIPQEANVFMGVSNVDVNLELRGVMVYNDGKDLAVPAGIYIWNGFSWTKDGHLNPASLPAGAGTFNGMTRFDIADRNFNVNDCASQLAREGRKTVFADRTSQDGALTAPLPPYSGVQVYTFTPIGKVSHVRFDYVETSGVSIERIVPESPDYVSADEIDYPCKVAVHYRAELDTELQGTTRATGNKLKLYALYNSDALYSDPANDKKLELGVSLQDCNACGAYTVSGAWLNFLCHNLGANETYDPFTPAAPIHGARYKFGAQNAVLSMAADQSDAGIVSGWANVNIEGNWPPGNNPCPAGWRLPTSDDWEGVKDNNTWTKVGDSWIDGADSYANGYKAGDALFLPATGLREYTNGSLRFRGYSGYYWCSNENPFRSDNYVHIIRYVGGGNREIISVSQWYGMSVRCVEE
jgi:uncharacterized protein (TIGR02145 family)